MNARWPNEEYAGQPKLFERVLSLFPDGPPSAEVRDAILKEEGIGELSGLMEEITKVDNERALHVEMPAGTRVDAQRQGLNIWRFEISSAPAPSGERVSLKFTVKGSDKYESSRVDMQLAMAAVSGDMMTIKRKLYELIRKYGDGTIEGGRYTEMPAAFRPAYEAMTSPVWLRFNNLYKMMNKASKTDEVVDFSYLDVEVQTPQCDAITNFEGRWFGSTPGANPMVEQRIKAVLACIAMLEISWEGYQADLIDYEEEMEKAMAKNAGGSRWYFISGNRKNINKIANSFTHSSIFHVLADGETLYCWLQEREWKFLAGIVKSNSCRVTECDEPVYGQTKCGKNHMKPGIHSRKCNACKRAESNEALALESKPSEVQEPMPPVPTGAIGNANKPKTGYGMRPIPPNGKKAEEKEWEARNGPVITVQGPQEAAEDDYATLATENRRVADELLARATYYERIAEHFEALLNPTPAVQEAEAAHAEALRIAEAALVEAKAKVEADRATQKAELDALIANGPPV